MELRMRVMRPTRSTYFEYRTMTANTTRAVRM